MPTVLNRLLRLLPTNPICLRIIQGGSRRMRHLSIRSGYLACMILVLLAVLLGQMGSEALTMRSASAAGANMFALVSYLQVALVCLLTPVFMASAIAQEANPRTWDILLSTPLSNAQIVLGNMAGRLFFVISLLLSSLPLFLMMQYFGGVPGTVILSGYLIAGSSALTMSAIAITLCVTRTAGRRAVFMFYVGVVLFLVATWAADAALIVPPPGAVEGRLTTFFTPLNPFLALRVLLESHAYVPHDPGMTSASWIGRYWFGRPLLTFNWIYGLLSVFLLVYSILRIRIIGTGVSDQTWYQRLLSLPATGAQERPARTVGRNPIAWRESIARGQTLAAIIGRWGFFLCGILIALVLLLLYHTGTIGHEGFRLSMTAVLGAEMLIIVLTALNMSATTVSREREEGTLDLILTTPIQPGAYLHGKHRGLITYMLPLTLVPVITFAFLALYVLMDGLGREGGITVTGGVMSGAGTAELPVILPEGALAFPLVFIPFVTFTVMVGLMWSIRSRGTIGSVIAASGIVLALVGVLTLCGQLEGGSEGLLGLFVRAPSPLNTLLACIFSQDMGPGRAWPSDAGQAGGRDLLVTARIGFVIAAFLSGLVYAAVAGALHNSMKRSFMMTTRRLAGQQ